MSVPKKVRIFYLRYLGLIQKLQVIPWNHWLDSSKGHTTGRLTWPTLLPASLNPFKKFISFFPSLKLCKNQRFFMLCVPAVSCFRKSLLFSQEIFTFTSKAFIVSFVPERSQLLSSHRISQSNHSLITRQRCRPPSGFSLLNIQSKNHIWQQGKQ